MHRTIVLLAGTALAWVMPLGTTSQALAADYPGLAVHAVEIAKDDSNVLWMAAFAVWILAQDGPRARDLAYRALRLNPNSSMALTIAGWVESHLANHDKGIELIGRALRLSPRESVGTPLWLVGESYFFKRQFEMAEPKLLLSIQDNPGSPPAYRTLAACYAHMGRLDEARAIVAKLRALTPLVVYRDLPFRNAEDNEFFLSALRLAAGETS